MILVLTDRQKPKPTRRAFFINQTDRYTFSSQNIQYEEHTEHQSEDAADYEIACSVRLLRDIAAAKTYHYTACDKRKHQHADSHGIVLHIQNI